MATYKIVGPLPIVGHEPGSIITDEDLALCNIDWLIELGHITSEATSAATEAAPAVTKED